MAPEDKFVLTDQQLNQLSIMSGLRLPMEHIAKILGMSKSTLERIAKRDDRVRDAMDRGRAEASYQVRGTLFQRAVGEKDREGRWITPPDMNALRFWCQTQEGFKTQESIEVTQQISVMAMTPEQRQAEIARLIEIRQLAHEAE